MKIRRVGYPPYTKTFDDLKEARTAVNRVLADQSRGLRINPLLAERSTLADVLNAPSKNIRDDLRIVSEILETFRSNFPRTGNPVGTNAEITGVLAGNNKLQLALIPPDHPAIDRSTGELLDRWGTPFFFHAESGSRMEVRSAGPDKKHHTADDEAFIP